jgi:hypothetical protein
LTAAEETRRQVFLDRLVEPGDPLAVDLGTTASFGGCGVWEIEIASDGAVTSAIFVRGEPLGAYERFVGRWLRLFRFEASDEPWAATVLIRFTE